MDPLDDDGTIGRVGMHVEEEMRAMMMVEGEKEGAMAIASKGW